MILSRSKWLAQHNLTAFYLNRWHKTETYYSGAKLCCKDNYYYPQSEEAVNPFCARKGQKMLFCC